MESSQTEKQCVLTNLLPFMNKKYLEAYFENELPKDIKLKEIKIYNYEDLPSINLLKK
jgi:hypothetical protein